MIEAMVDEALLQKIAAYQPSAATIELLQKTPIALVAGITGAGKDTIVTELLKSGSYHRIVSHTTRPLRKNRGVMEQNGVEYHFIDFATANKLLDEHAYIEAKIYSDNIYGTTVDEIRRAHDEHKIAISDVEVKGVAEYVALTPTVRPIFVLPPSYDTWQQRFLARYGGNQTSYAADIHRRLEIARDELHHARSTDYYSLVINDDLATAVTEVDSLAHLPTNEPVRPLAALTLINELLDRLDATLAALA